MLLHLLIICSSLKELHLVFNQEPEEKGEKKGRWQATQGAATHFYLNCDSYSQGSPQACLAYPIPK
jgi:hypothetical protein